MNTQEAYELVLRTKNARTVMWWLIKGQGLYRNEKPNIFFLEYYFSCQLPNQKALGECARELRTDIIRGYERLDGVPLEYETACRNLEAIAEGYEATNGDASFYRSKAWLALRYEVLCESDGVCKLCGTTKAHGSRMVVDHIKPRSKYPELALDRTNLRLICSPCNMGKGSRDETDFRDKA